MYQSKLKINNSYGNLIFPKKLIEKRGWKPGDLLLFVCFDSSYIAVKKLFTKEQLKLIKEKKYDQRFCKKLCKFGGASGSVGVKGFPKILIEELELDHNILLNFLPVEDTWIFDSKNPQETVYLAKDRNILKKLIADESYNHDEWIKKHYVENNSDLPFFNGQLELSDKNTAAANRKVIRFHKKITRERIRFLKAEIERLKNDLEYIKGSKHPKKKEIIERQEGRIKVLESELQYLENNDMQIFDVKGKKEKIKPKKASIRKSTQYTRQKQHPSARGYFFLKKSD